MANCDACGGPVNDAVVKCPHCGEKRTVVTPAVYSRAEIQALIDTDPAAHTDSSAMLKALLLPHKSTRGIMRILEVALAAVAAPAILLGALGMFLFGRRRRFISYGTTNRERSQAMLSTSGELAPVVVMTLLGGGAFSIYGGDYALIAIGAMWARAAVRMISAGKREREMIEMDQRDAAKRALASGPVPALPPSRPSRPSSPPATAPLPPARVVSEQTRPSAPFVVKEPIKAPEPVKPTDPNDEPSILR